MFPRVVLCAGPPNGAPVVEFLQQFGHSPSWRLVGVIADEKLHSRCDRQRIARAPRHDLRRAAERAGVPVVNTAAMRHPRFLAALRDEWRPDIFVQLDTCSAKLSESVRQMATLGLAQVSTAFRRASGAPTYLGLTWNGARNSRRTSDSPAMLLALADLNLPVPSSGFYVARQSLSICGEDWQAAAVWIDERARTFENPNKNRTFRLAMNGFFAEIAWGKDRRLPHPHVIELRLLAALAATTAEVIQRGLQSILSHPRGACDVSDGADPRATA